MEKSSSLPLPSTIARELPPSGIRRFFDIVARMEDVISLGIGEPDFVTPWSIREAGIYSLERGQTAYTSNYGLIELRQLIGHRLHSLYGVSYNPENEILITVGVSEGLDLAMRALLDPGDEVLIPEPGYASYRPCVSLAGGVPVGVLTTATNEFRITPEDLEKKRTPRTKAILFGYPSNPTGATMDSIAMQAIVDYAVRHNLFIVSDEIYDRLTYSGSHVCVPSLPGAKERTILLNGFSKTYAMTGWRIGYACAPRAILDLMVKLHAYTMLCAPTIGQKAAIEALKSAESAVNDMVSQYNQRRRLIVNGLNNIGLSCHLPNGAFYAFPSVKNTGLTSEEFAERLLMEERVAVVPGTAFGVGGEYHVRCSYATSMEKIEIALKRIGQFMLKIKPKLQSSDQAKV
jgi:aminotransferase